MDKGTDGTCLSVRLRGRGSSPDRKNSGARLPAGSAGREGRSEGDTRAWVLAAISLVTSHPSAVGHPWSCTSGDLTCTPRPSAVTSHHPPPSREFELQVSGWVCPLHPGPGPWHMAWPPLGTKETSEPHTASVRHLKAHRSLWSLPEHPALESSQSLRHPSALGAIIPLQRGGKAQSRQRPPPPRLTGACDLMTPLPRLGPAAPHNLERGCPGPGLTPPGRPPGSVLQAALLSCAPVPLPRGHGHLPSATPQLLLPVPHPSGC